MQTTLSRWLVLLLVLTSLASYGCGEGPQKDPIRLPPPDPIQEFVDGQPLPKAQPVHIIAAYDNDLTFFRVDYGDYLFITAWGLKNGDKLGWIILPSGVTDSTGLTMYDPVTTDASLFEQSTWDSVQAIQAPYDSWLYWGGLMPMLARDSDVPPARLLAIAEQLDTRISENVAYRLLENPVVQTNRDILTVLANLPVFQGDVYGPIRLQAQTLLNQLPPV